MRVAHEILLPYLMKIMPRCMRVLGWFSVLAILGLAPLGPAVAAHAQGKVPERSQIDIRYTWDLAAMYPNLAAWEADFKSCEQALDGIARMKGTVTKSPETLLSFLTAYEDLAAKFSKVGSYASLLKDQDVRQSSPQAMYDRAATLGVRLGESASWFEPEILSLPDGKLLAWCKGNPKLAIYTHHFDDLLRQKQHVLSAREEELMAMSGKLAATPGEAFSMLANADMKFPTIKDEKGNDVQLSEGRYITFMRSPDRALRERAFKATLGAYLSFKNTMATTLAGSVQGDIFRARARHYSRLTGGGAGA